MKILAVGDIVGRCGIEKLKECLPDLMQKNQIDFCVVNRRERSRAAWELQRKCIVIFCD